MIRGTLMLAFASLVAALVLSLPALAEDRIAIVIYNGLGTTAGAQISGRALEDEGLQAPSREDSTATKAWRMLQALESDEVEGVKLKVEAAGRTAAVVTDDEGLFDLRLKGPLPVGTHPVKVTVTNHQRWRALPGAIAVFPAKAATVVISDFDDTVVATHVTNKLKMVKGLLTTNMLDLQAFAGAARVYRALRSRGWPVVFVSGSPINLHTRIDRFLRHHRFPVAPLFLKRLGRKDTNDALFSHDSYKLKQIEKVMALLPGYQLVLVGDSGEKDPEVYREVARRYPQRVHKVLIHNVTAARQSEPRYAGQVLFTGFSPAFAAALGTPTPPPTAAAPTPRKGAGPTPQQAPRSPRASGARGPGKTPASPTGPAPRR